MTTNILYQPKRHIAIIESARGFAALYVLLTHVIELTGVHDALAMNSPLRLFIDLFLIYGHQAVLLFFVLSGFSIHYTSVDRNLSRLTELKYYYYLRWRRIYPIFVMAVCITLGLDLIGAALGIGIYQEHLSELNSQQLLFTLTFLTDVHDIAGVMQPTLHSNGPLWSLSYEVFYYLIYPLYWYINRHFGIAGAITFGISVSASSFLLSHFTGAQHFLNVLDLYAIWCLGAVLAEMVRRGFSCRLPMLIHAPIIYILLQSAWVLENATYTVGAVFDITWGLLFFFIMLLYTNNKSLHDLSHWQKIATALAAVFGYLVIIAGVETLEFVDNLVLFYSHISLTLLLLLIGLTIPKLNLIAISNALLKPGYSFGKYSYGIYVIHFPILLFFVQLLIYFKLAVWYCVIFVPAILLLAKFIELRYQSFILQHTDTLATRWGFFRKRG